MSTKNNSIKNDNLSISDIIVRFLKDESEKPDVNIAYDRIKIGIQYNFDTKKEELVITDKNNNRIIKVIDNNEL